MKYIRTVVLLMPSFLPHQAQTPKAWASNQRTIRLIMLRIYESVAVFSSFIAGFNKEAAIPQ